jgi:hypothetical protein
MRLGRMITAMVLVASLTLAGLARRWAEDERLRASSQRGFQSNGPESASARLSSMNSYALALLLGGLRGPLVMFLWSSSESQKTEHDLEDFDTKVEWIRLLQPEFDTVHLFEIWNKAYNISVQMADLPDKYATILDALDYANSVDRQKPDDINIIFQIGSVYADKLGQSTEEQMVYSAERRYYLRRIRAETTAYRPLVRITAPQEKLDSVMEACHRAGMDEPMGEPETDEVTNTTSLVVERSVADAVEKSLSDPTIEFRPLPPPTKSTDPRVKRVRLDPMLDENGNILPELLAPTHPFSESGLPAGSPWYDGSTLQFLRDYQPFPYGIGPEAIGFNYLKRAQMMERVLHEEHIQSSDFVVDSRPALVLEAWGTEQADQGRRAECRLFGQNDQGERMDLEQRVFASDPKTAGPALVQTGIPAVFPDPAAAPMVLHSYAMAATLFRDSLAEGDEHVRRFPRSEGVFKSHHDQGVAMENLYAGDDAFWEGLLDPAKRPADWAEATDDYVKAQQGTALLIMRYFTDEEVIRASFPKNPVTGRQYNREDISQLPASERDALLVKVLAATEGFLKNHMDEFSDDRTQQLKYLEHAAARLMTMGRADLASQTMTPASATLGPAAPR